MKAFLKRIAVLFGILCELILITSVFAGTTGKIAGKVSDSATKEPLIGANVSLAGTNFGAATDARGNYVILNVPPGKYDLRFQYIGYQTVVVKGVTVNVDFTTRVDQSLRSSTIEMQEIEVVAERTPLVREDLTNTQVAITADAIQSMPVDQIREVIRLQAGIVEGNDGAIHIRGGRSNEISYQVNGVSIANPFSNLQGVGIATNAVQEVSVSSGTFSAEYGNALSGVVNYVTKEGGNSLNASFRAYTGDHFTTHDDIFFGIDNFDAFNNARVEATLGGPLPFASNKINFFFSGVYQKNKGYLYGIDIYDPSDILLLNEQSFIFDPFGDGKPSGTGKIVPMNVRESYNLTAKFSYRLSPTMKLTYDIIYDKGKRPSGGQFRNFRFNPRGRRFLRTQGANHSLGLTHTLGKKTFYKLKLSAALIDAKNWVFDNPQDPRYQASFNGNVFNNLFPQTDYLAGGDNLNRARDNTRSYTAKLDFVSQVHPAHELRFGGEFTRHRLERESYTLLHNDITGHTLPIVPYPWRNPEFTSYQYYVRKPIQAAAYILDKIELARSFILNLGLRWEYLETKALYNPDLVGSVDTGVDKNLIPTRPKSRLAPRISLSFPITDKGIIRFSYGHFYQNPTFSSIYRNPRFEDLDFTDVPTFGNPNLEPEKSIQYEVGLQQGFSDNFKADLTIYYKDVSNLIQTRRLVAGEVAASKEFNVVTNISYANVKGFTASLLMRRSPGSLLSFSIDYTFQVAEGALTNPLNFFLDTRSGRQTEQEFRPLSFDRRHVLNGTVSLARPNNWSFSAIANFWSGTPYTPRLPSSVQPVEFKENSARRPSILNVNLRLDKKFKIGKLLYSLFVRVDNVLDLKNERFVWSSTGRSLTALQEKTNPNRFSTLLRQMDQNPGLFFPKRFIKNFYKREDWLSEPRKVRIGISLEYR